VWHSGEGRATEDANSAWQGAQGRSGAAQRGGVALSSPKHPKTVHKKATSSLEKNPWKFAEQFFPFPKGSKGTNPLGSLEAEVPSPRCLPGCRSMRLEMASEPQYAHLAVLWRQ
jgi:hypothetical protein